MGIFKRLEDWEEANPFFSKHPMLAGIFTVAIFGIPFSVILGFAMGKLDQIF